ncbi:hypothetical protein [Synechococcus sp. PCC 7335]|uniref:NrtR DNA-binding winged helix domain-containing protein n=1 Tax=Synechococcus sp. (strain ATCC 29403 / PCC 7335) TaxID=91464 RepID=UPI0021012335|nr:hypothetical protein [Synechococcus sp. PCC 7335]
MLSQLQQIYEQILERDLDKRNFRAKLLKMELLINTSENRRSSQSCEAIPIQCS